MNTELETRMPWMSEFDANLNNAENVVVTPDGGIHIGATTTTVEEILKTLAPNHYKNSLLDYMRHFGASVNELDEYSVMIEELLK